MGGLIIAASLVGALAWGIWLGLPRRYDQPLDEIDKRLEERGRHQRVRRIPTMFGFLQKKLERGSKGRRRQARKPFRMS